MNKEKLPNCLTVKPWNGLCICTVCVHVCPITIPHSSLSYTVVIHLRDGKDSQAGKLTMFFPLACCSYNFTRPSLLSPNILLYQRRLYVCVSVSVQNHEKFLYRRVHRGDIWQEEFSLRLEGRGDKKKVY